jgi:outer membrane protein, multidrug efflux system
MNRKHIYIFISAAIISGCSTLKLPTERALKPMPETFAGSSNAADTATLTKNNFFTDEKLSALIDTAIAYNNDLLNAYQNIEMAKASVRFAKGLRLPVANAAFNPNLRKFGLFTMDGAGNATTDIQPGKVVPVNLPDYFAGFQSSWEADIYGKLKNKQQAALARYLSTVEGKNWLQANLINAIALNYYQLLSLDEQLNIINQNISVQQEILEIIKLQKEALRSNELAVNQFTAQIVNAKAVAKEIEQAIVETENSINLLLSRYPQKVERDTNWLSQPIAVLAAGIPSQLLQNRPDIKMAEYELVASRFDVTAAKKAFYPTISINASLGLQAFSPATFFNPQSITYGLFGGLLAPVFNRSALQAEFNTQSALQLQALNNYQQTMITAFGEVYTCIKKIENLQQAAEFKIQEVMVLETAIENAKLLFQANRATYLEVLTAQQNLLNAKIALVQIKQSQKQETANLFKSIGGGWR